MRWSRITLVLLLGIAPLCAQNAVLHSVQVLGGSGVDTVTSITPDKEGNIYVLGTTQSADFPATVTFGTALTSSSSQGDTFVAKIRLDDWSLTWCAIIRPSMPLALAVDGKGSVYVTGHTSSPTTFPATAGAFRGQIASGLEALFVLKLDPSGAKIIYSALLSTYEYYSDAALAVDSLGQAYVTATGTAPVTAGAFVGTASPNFQQGFLAKLRADGTGLVFCTYLSRGGTTEPYAVAVDGQQNVFVGGSDRDYLSTFPVTPGAVQSTHAGGSDAFVMKFRPDGSSIEFATLLGGDGSDFLNFLRLGDEGSIYIAGWCVNGSPESADHPFPTTNNAPFRQVTPSVGFVARLNPTGTSLLFSTYVSNIPGSIVSGLALASGRVYVAYPTVIQRGFPGLLYSFYARARSTGVLALQSDGSADGAATVLPAFAPDGFAVWNDMLLAASNGSPINLPVPSTVIPIGPLGRDPAKSKRLQSNISLAKFFRLGTPDHDLDTDRGYLVFEALLGTSPAEQSVSITSASNAIPFQVFTSLTSCCSETSPYTFTATDSVTPATVTVRVGSTYDLPTDSPPALLLVSPLASQSIQILPLLDYPLHPELVVTGPGELTLPVDGGTADGSMSVRATANSVLTGKPVELAAPFQLDVSNATGVLTLDPLSGTTPSLVRVTALDSLKPGGFDAREVVVKTTGSSKSIYIGVTKPAPPQLVTPTFITLFGFLGLPAVSTSVQLNLPADTPFQVQAVPDRLHVEPSSGVGPSKLTVTADLSRYPIGTAAETFVVQVGDALVTVTARVTLSQFPLIVALNNYSPGNVCPGLRTTIFASGSAAGLPSTGAWQDLSPAPTDWNGYSFLYRSRKLSILSANPDSLTFEVQFPYDLDLAGNREPISLVSSDGTVLSTTPTYGSEKPSCIGILPYVPGSDIPLKADGSRVTSDNPAHPGDLIRVSILGAGATSPRVNAGELPGDGRVVTPTVPIVAAIGGKDAAIVREALSPTLIGVTDLDIVVPNLAAGLHMLGLASQGSTLSQIPVWVVK